MSNTVFVFRRKSNENEARLLGHCRARPLSRKEKRVSRSLVLHSSPSSPSSSSFCPPFLPPPSSTHPRLRTARAKAHLLSCWNDLHFDYHPRLCKATYFAIVLCIVRNLHPFNFQFNCRLKGCIATNRKWGLR